MTGPFRNGQGQVSGAKSVLLLACGLAVAWLGRDLLTGRELTEWHAALLGVLLLVGLVNRMSGRGYFRARFKDMEVESRDSDHGKN
ncbi:MAG: hypothetical protein LBV79_06190 [Candidatus Adiutrix sp.]|nr:hypothetical protein [Candidatus Adiutrix sp.]